MRVLIAAAAAVLVLPACSGDDDDAIVPTTPPPLPVAASVPAAPAPPPIPTTTAVAPPSSSAVPFGADVSCADLFAPGRPVAAIVGEVWQGSAVCVDDTGAKTIAFVQSYDCDGDAKVDVWGSNFGWGRAGGVWQAGADPRCGP
jgi:hypothetical protein